MVLCSAVFLVHQNQSLQKKDSYMGCVRLTVLTELFLSLVQLAAKVHFTCCGLVPVLLRGPSRAITGL